MRSTSCSRCARGGRPTSATAGRRCGREREAATPSAARSRSDIADGESATQRIADRDVARSVGERVRPLLLDDVAVLVEDDRALVLGDDPAVRIGVTNLET